MENHKKKLLHFRNYVPMDEQLRELTLSRLQMPTVDNEISELEALGTVPDEVDFVNFAPRKPDWDLKRDLAPKLAKLNIETQRAVHDLVAIANDKGEEE